MKNFRDIASSNFINDFVLGPEWEAFLSFAWSQRRENDAPGLYTNRRTRLPKIRSNL